MATLNLAKNTKISPITTLLLSFVLIFTLGFTSTTLMAAPPNPPPDCYPGWPWEGPESYTFSYKKCVITYSAWYRYACNAWYDSYIEITYMTGDCADIELDPERYNEYMDECMADLMRHLEGPHYQAWRNPAIPSCKQGMSGDQWRFFRPNCFAQYTEWIIDETGYPQIALFTIPCPGVEGQGYCYAIYNFCWKEEGGYIVLDNRRDPATGGYHWGTTPISCPGETWRKEECEGCPDCYKLIELLPCQATCGQ